MQVEHNIELKNIEDEINLKELFHVLIRGKWIIVSVTGFMSIIGVIYSLQLPNIYESRALLVSVDSSSSISGTLKNYSGLAGLAGISLPSSSPDSNSAKAIKTMSSLSFFENNLMPQIFLPDLMAVDSWDEKTNIITYDEGNYNKNSNSWIILPSAQESFSVFKGHLTIIEDKQDGFITLTIKHQSPLIAKQWVELIINEVNTFYKQKDKSQSEKSVNYLNNQIAMTTLSEVKQVFAELLQQETQKLTLVEANEFYVFDYIDPPAVMEKKSEPSRAILCILSALLGGMLSIVLVLIKHYTSRKKAS
tara:strand:+ start:2830 stop:3747 length:918 start_codon:yes stop_codon:yes gene_type:complete